MMGLLEPLSLLWLLLLLPAILVLYLLKLKRRPVVVSSVLLWSRVLKDAQANAPFQKLRKNLLLLLQLLVVFLVVFGLSRPFVRAQALGGERVAVVLDGSASMKSRDAGGSRFDAARAAALKMVDSMQAGDAMMVLLATSRPQRLAPFTSDRSLLRRALQAAEPADTTTNLRDAIQMAAAIAGSAAGRGRSILYILSDGATGDLDEIDMRGSEVQFVRFGSHAENVGIVAFDVRRPSGSRDFQGFVAVRNYGAAARTGTLELYRDTNLFDARPLSLPAAGERGYSEQAIVLERIPPGAAILRARVDVQDDLDADNEAYAQVGGGRQPRVLLVTAGNVFLEKAILADPDVRLEVTAPGGYRGQPGYDVIVLDGVAPQRVGPGNFLYIDAGGPTCPAEPERRTGETTVADWSRSHPVLRYVNLQGLTLKQPWKAKVRPWGQELAAAADGAVIAAGERQDAAVEDQRLTFKSLYVGFSLLESDFWQRVGFPIFVGNAIDWLAARPGQSEGQQLRTGEVAEIGLPGGVRSATVTDPKGRRRKVDAEGPVLLYRDTEDAGIYTVEGPNRFRAQFAANLLSREESDTRPREKLQMGRRPVAAAAPGRMANLETWRWLVLLALAVLALEWYAYHRRL